MSVVRAIKLYGGHENDWMYGGKRTLICKILEPLVCTNIDTLEQRNSIKRLWDLQFDYILPVNCCNKCAGGYNDKRVKCHILIALVDSVDYVDMV